MIILIITFTVLVLSLFFLIMKNNNEKIDEGLRISESITQYKPLRTKEDYINDTIDAFQKYEGNEVYDNFKKIEIRGITRVFDEPNSKEPFVFSGGCYQCKSIEKFGIGRCKGCRYFYSELEKPDLNFKS